MSIRLTNSSYYKGNYGNTDWWNWTAYLECEEPDSLDDIAYVEYHLHPSFKNPVRRIKKKTGGFPVKSTGWGVFTLIANVIFKDKNRKPKQLKHMLTFEQPNN